jgi:hypothetical protein
MSKRLGRLPALPMAFPSRDQRTNPMTLGSHIERSGQKVVRNTTGM